MRTPAERVAWGRTVAGAAAGAGAGRLLFGNNTTGMLIGAAAGGLAGNMTLDRQAEARRQGEAAATQDAAMQRQLDFERQRALQATKSSGRSKNGGCSSNGSASAPGKKVKTDGRRLGATGQLNDNQGGTSVADLVCVAFDDPTTADRALTELTALQKEYLIELKDACVVVRSPDGEVHLHQAMPLVKTGALAGGSSGALWGTLIGLLFLNPLAGMAIGAGSARRAARSPASSATTASPTISSRSSAARSSRTRPPCSSWCRR